MNPNLSANLPDGRRAKAAIRLENRPAPLLWIDIAFGSATQILTPTPRVRSRGSQVLTFPASLRQIVEQSLEGVSGYAVATNYQAYHALSPSAVKRENICVQVRYRLIEKLLVVLDRHFPEPVYGVVRQAEPMRKVNRYGLRFFHDIVPTHVLARGM
jgi:hypothetical protein